MQAREILVVAGLSAALLYGQTDRGVISGEVRDTTGAVVPGAKVSAINVSTNVTTNTQSNEAGAFTVPALPAGTYRLTIEREGFKSFVQTGVALAAGGET